MAITLNFYNILHPNTGQKTLLKVDFYYFLNCRYCIASDYQISYTIY